MILKEITKWKSSSFHGTIITATPYDLMNLAGKFNIEYYSGNDGKIKQTLILHSRQKTAYSLPCMTGNKINLLIHTALIHFILVVKTSMIL